MDKVIVITGASAGIGKAAAELFTAKGDTVFNFSRRPSDSVGVKNILTDVSSRENVAASVESVIKEAGKIDVLINCAGMGISGAVEDTSEEAVRKIFNINYFGTLFAIQSVLPFMRTAGGGTIINISSAAAPLSIPFQAFYSNTKAAVTSLTEALRSEVRPFNIKVTNVLPGDVKTSFTAMRQKNPVNSGVYGEHISRSVEKMEHDEQNGMSPEVIAKLIYRLAYSKNPPVSVVGGAPYKALVFLGRHLPQRAVSSIIYKLYG